MREIRLLRLPHQQQRHGEDREGVQAGRVVRDGHHAADEPVDHVVRQQPCKAFLEDVPPSLVALNRHRERDETHVDREVEATRNQAGAGDHELVVARQSEDAGCGK